MDWKPGLIWALWIAVGAICGIPLVFLFVKTIIDFWQQLGGL